MTQRREWFVALPTRLELRRPSLARRGTGVPQDGRRAVSLDFRIAAENGKSRKPKQIQSARNGLSVAQAEAPRRQNSA